MLSKRAQVVIGIGVIILSAAFLLVGVYFANLQGLFFQNGARSLQLFADNIAFSINSLYSAPSSMSITLNGNNSLCSWNPSISAYTCAGGSKIYNVSYSNGPTLDSGKNVFSIALCFMVGYGFGGVGGGEDTAKEAADAAASIGEAEGQDAIDQGFQTLVALRNGALRGEMTDDLESAGLTKFGVLAYKIKSGVSRGLIDVGSKSKEMVFQDIPEDDILSSSLSNIQNALRTSSKFIPTAIASMSAALVAVPIVELWFGTSNRNLNTYITKGIYANGQQIGALTGPSISISQQVAAAYLSQEPLPFKYAAVDLILQQYSHTLSSASTLSSLPPSLGKDNLILLLSKQVAIKQNVLSELSSNAQAGAASNPYSTPSGGVSAPGTLSSPSSIAGSVALSSTGSDPFLSTAFFLAQNGFLVYARTASCLSIPSQPSNLNNYGGSKAFSSIASELGAATTLINVYDKVNSVLPLGTYFVGYGGEVYLDGQSSGRPTQVTAPLITDMKDMCELAQTSAQPGENLKTIIQPSGNGSISFTISQGLYNTLCSKNNALFPHTLQRKLNALLNSKSTQQNVSILLPPGDALAISNQKSKVSLCIYHILIDSFGSPILSTNNFASSNFNVTEYGSPVSCINITNLSKGKVNFGINRQEINNLNNNMLASKDFYINNASFLGFSVPVTDFPNKLTAGNSPSSSFLSAGNFIGGGQPVLKKELGVNFPVASFIASFLGKKLPKIQGSVSTALDSFLISPLYILSSYNTNLSYYETDYANVTLNFVKNQNNGITYYNISNIYNNLVFGVYPNNPNSFGGTYFSKS